MVLKQIKIYVLILISTIISCSSTFGLINRKLIQGKWRGVYENIQMVLTFKKNSGSIVYFPQNKAFYFKYEFGNDSTLIITNGRQKSRHVIKYLTDSTLKMSPYPILTDSESIDLIDQVEFNK